jgi:hypothetical protein
LHEAEAPTYGNPGRAVVSMTDFATVLADLEMLRVREPPRRRRLLTACLIEMWRGYSSPGPRRSTINGKVVIRGACIVNEKTWLLTRSADRITLKRVAWPA